jgi:hypothetical protein
MPDAREISSRLSIILESLRKQVEMAQVSQKNDNRGVPCMFHSEAGTPDARCQRDLQQIEHHLGKSKGNVKHDRLDQLQGTTWRRNGSIVT